MMINGDTLELGAWANCGSCDVEIPTPRDGVRMGGVVLCPLCVAAAQGRQCDNCRVFRPDVEPMPTPHGEGSFCLSCAGTPPECPECGDAMMMRFGTAVNVGKRLVHAQPWSCPACGHRM